jgi:uncharacterized YigZ family protein
MRDEYVTIASNSEAELKVQGSRFLACASPVHTRAEAHEFLDGLKKRYFDATHHCYAYRIGKRGEDFRAHDDGEPGGTAGKPILAAIDARGLTDTMLVVVRYFGGTKLGTGGLAHAYSDAASSALEKAGRSTMFITETIAVTVPHNQTGALMNAVSQHGVKIIDSAYDEEVHLTLEIRTSAADLFCAQIVNATRGNVDLRRGVK